MEKIRNIHGYENLEKYCPGITKEIELLIERANNGFTQGYTCACANLVRLTGNADGTIEVELLQQSVSKLSELEKHKVDDSDLEVLKPTLIEIERKRKIRNP